MSRGHAICRATVARLQPCDYRAMVASRWRDQIWNAIFRDLTSHTALETRTQSRRRLVAACRSTLLRACDRVASCDGGQRDQAVAIGSSRELPAATSLSCSCEGLHLNQCSAIGRATQSRDKVASCEGALSVAYPSLSLLLRRAILSLLRRLPLIQRPSLREPVERCRIPL